MPKLCYNVYKVGQTSN